MAISRRTLTWILVVAVVVLGLAVPKWRATRSGGDPKQSAEPVVEDRLLVQVETLRPGVLTEKLATTGTVLANESVALIAEVPGKVVEILFSEGRSVDAGQVLLRLDDSVGRAEVERARHRLELATRREQRQQELLGQELISQEDYDAALSELNVLVAEVALREAQLVKMAIRAPFSGIVGLRSVSLGSYLSNQTPIAMLQDIDPVKIEFSIPERYVGEVEVGQEIEFRVNRDEEKIMARIYAIEPSVDRDTRSLTMRARTPNPDGRLIPGAFADVELAVRQVYDAISVPSMAVVPELGGKKVFVVAGGVAEARIVRTGIRTESRVEITDGLEAGEQVIVSAIQRLRTGLAIEPRAENDR